LPDSLVEDIRIQIRKIKTFHELDTPRELSVPEMVTM